MLIRSMIIFSALWVCLLMTNYGVLITSQRTFSGYGIECQYLTGRGLVNSQLLHKGRASTPGSECPILKKNDEIVER